MKEEALKLADDLEELHEQDLIDGVAHLSMPQASAMIRRLVEELDEKNYRILELTKRYKALTWNDKQSEPVVYWDGKHFASREKSSLADIPLYTTPQTKPLSDEEIWELHQEHIDEIPCGHSMKTIGFVEFARAIEERHGIK